MVMQPLQCRACSRAIMVEKFSAAHTSIQWLSDASECPLIASGDHPLATMSRTCVELRRTIDEAVEAHELVESRIELPTGVAIPRLH